MSLQCIAMCVVEPLKLKCICLPRPLTCMSVLVLATISLRELSDVDVNLDNYMFAYRKTQHLTFNKSSIAHKLGVPESRVVLPLSAPSAVTVVEGPALPAVIIDHT